MNYISQSPIHCSKGYLKCVITAPTLLGKRQWIYVQDKLGACFNKKKGKKKFTFPIFDYYRIDEQNVGL